MQNGWLSLLGCIDLWSLSLLISDSHCAINSLLVNGTHVFWSSGMIFKAAKGVHRLFWYIYRPQSEGDNALGSVRPSVRPFVCALTAEPLDPTTFISRRMWIIARMRSIGALIKIVIISWWPYSKNMIKSPLLYVFLNYFHSPAQTHCTPFSTYPNGPLGLVMHIIG